MSSLLKTLARDLLRHSTGHNPQPFECSCVWSSPSTLRFCSYRLCVTFLLISFLRIFPQEHGSRSRSVFICGRNIWAASVSPILTDFFLGPIFLALHYLWFCLSNLLCQFYGSTTFQNHRFLPLAPQIKTCSVVCQDWHYVAVETQPCITPR